MKKFNVIDTSRSLAVVEAEPIVEAEAMVADRPELIEDSLDDEYETFDYLDDDFNTTELEDLERRIAALEIAQEVLTARLDVIEAENVTLRRESSRLRGAVLDEE